MIVFDLEWIAWEGAWQREWSGPGEYREIVQIGAVRVADGFTEVDSLNLLVRPRLNPILSDYFIALTGIPQSDLDRNGVDIAEALDLLEQFCGDEAKVCSNGPDHLVIEENCQMFGLPVPLQGRWCNVNGKLCALTGRDRIVSSDLNAVLDLGHDDARAHDALEDARAIARALAFAERQGQNRK